jgi:hypothetical protein
MGAKMAYTMDYRTEETGFNFWQRQRFFLFPTVSISVVAHAAAYQRVMRAVSLHVKQPRHGAVPSR